MRNIYQQILTSKAEGSKLLAILIDPEKFQLENTFTFLEEIHKTNATHIFVGGSTDRDKQIDKVILKLKSLTSLPVIIFPGDTDQISKRADGLLFLSLISGRNPDYLISKQVEAVSILRTMDLEVIPTGYILVESGKETSVERISNTKPMNFEAVHDICDTAKAGELLGMKLIYLEAGSGAKNVVAKDVIRQVSADLQIPLIVGGGIKTKSQLNDAYHAGADMVVIGNAFEENPLFFENLLNENHKN